MHHTRRIMPQRAQKREPGAQAPSVARTLLSALVGRHKCLPYLLIVGVLAFASGMLLASAIPLASAAPTSDRTIQIREALQALHHTNSSSSGHVTVIILDMSGSMAQNDPQGLRCSAANAYIDLSGPGDFVGVVGLDSTGASGGPHNFGTTVDWGLAPRELATVNARQALRSSIQQKSNGCKPDGSTPTYDALAKAEAMLASATQNGAISGSVILLTDGAPYPDANAQISAIQHDLAPQFKAHNWPVDIVALGSDQSFHPFLSGLASATSGSFYDDGHGVVPGVSPLNITPFFLAIFRLRNGRSPGPDVPPTQLNGGTTARNFSVGQYVTHLDIVVVKDNPNSSVSVLAPNGQRIPPPAAGAFVSTDPHYAIFSLDTPQQGAWELDVSGSGQFLMDSLKVSALTLTLISPSTKGALALGEAFIVSAQLSNQGTAVSGGKFSLAGTVAFAGDTGKTYTQDIVLTDQGGSGTYSAPVTIPTSAPTGSYQITVRAHAASEDVLTAQAIIRLDLFPSALLIGQHGATTLPVGVNVTQWDKPLEVLYSLPIVNFFSNWPLGGLPAQPSAAVNGQVELSGKLYSDATVAGTATRVGTTMQIPITFVNDGNGAFHLIFPSDANGSYTLALTTQGAYTLSHGDLTHVTRTVNVTIVPNTLNQRLRAYLFTFFYLLVLAFIILLIRYILAPKPLGAIISTPGGADEFARARRPMAFFLPSVVESGQMGLDPGLRFKFQRGGRVAVQGTNARDNYKQAGGAVPLTWFSAANTELSSSDGRVRYSVEAGGRGGADSDDGRLDTRAELMKRVVGTPPRTNDDDDEPRRGAGLFAHRRSYDDDDDDDRTRRGARSRSRSSSHYDDEDDDDRPRGRGRGRGRRSRDDDW